jgi:hypothetical protein
MMAITAAAMIKGALLLNLVEAHTVNQIDTAANAFGGTVILKLK